MRVELIPIKIKSRLNKIDSSDNQNIPCYNIVEAFNKAQLEWVRRQIHGGNQYRQGDESTRRRIDDLQILLKEHKVKGIHKELLFESNTLPKDYLELKRISVLASTDSCSRRKMRVYLIEEGNLDAYLLNHSKRPSFDWGETLATLLGNKIRVHTNDEFKVDDLSLTYYRKPQEISLAGCSDLDDNPTQNIDPEFKDDIVELLIDEAASILAADIESFNQHNRASTQVEENN